MSSGDDGGDDGGDDDDGDGDDVQLDDCRCLLDGTSEEGSSRGGEEVGAIGRSAHGTVVRDLPSFGTPAR